MQHHYLIVKYFWNIYYWFVTNGLCATCEKKISKAKKHKLAIELCVMKLVLHTILWMTLYFLCMEYFKRRCKKGILKFWCFNQHTPFFKPTCIYLICSDAAQSPLNASTFNFNCVMCVSTKEKLKRKLYHMSLRCFEKQLNRNLIVYIISVILHARSIITHWVRIISEVPFECWSQF